WPQPASRLRFFRNGRWQLTLALGMIGRERHIAECWGEEPMSEAQNAPPSGSGQVPDTVAPEQGAPGPSFPSRIGRYRVERLLGAGGLGKVSLAHDDQLRRRVAVKVPHPDRASRPGYAESYLAEARILAGLDHPHIVPVHDVGQTDNGLPFVVSKFIEGSDLAREAKYRRLSIALAAGIVAAVAEALPHPHPKALLHPPLKPATLPLHPPAPARRP